MATSDNVLESIFKLTISHGELKDFHENQKSDYSHRW